MSLLRRIPGFLDPAACARFTRGVYEGRAEWTEDFDGAQFTLGRAWYTHLEQDRTGAYFGDAGASDARVEAYCPRLQALLRDAISTHVGAGSVPRRGFCGPGVHVFPAGGWLARRGGDVHFDVEGLAPAQLKERAPALTCVLMLQPPETGGALRVWDATYEGSAEPTEAMLAGGSVDVDYAQGELLVLDSYRLHQIRPFGGTNDRISATCHAARVAGSWETWF